MIRLKYIVLLTGLACLQPLGLLSQEKQETEKKDNAISGEQFIKQYKQISASGDDEALGQLLTAHRFEGEIYANFLHNKGLEAFRVEDNLSAIEYLSDARDLYNYLKLNKSLLDCTLKIAETHERDGDNQDAIEEYEAALRMAYANQDREILLSTAIKTASLHRDEGAFTRALPLMQKVLDLFKDAKDSDEEKILILLNNIGKVYERFGKYKLALQYYQAAEKRLPKSKDYVIRGRVKRNLGYVYHELEDYEKALEYHQAALELLREETDAEGEADVLYNLAETYSQTGDKEQAGLFYLKSLGAAQQVGNKAMEARALTRITASNWMRSVFAKSIANYGHALQLISESPDSITMGLILRQLGEVQIAQGSYSDGLRALAESGALLVRKNRPKQVADLLLLQGRATMLVGKNREARKLLDRALRYAIQIEDSRRELEARIALGDLLLKIGQFEKSREQFKAALSVSGSRGWVKEGVIASGRLAINYLRQGKIGDAQDHYNRALNMISLLKPSQLTPDLAAATGELYLHFEEYVNAEGYFTRAANRYLDDGQNVLIADTHLSLGNIFLTIDDSTRALQHYRDAIELMAYLGDLDGLAWTWVQIGRVFVQYDQPDSAAHYVSEAAGFMESSGNLPGQAACFSLASEVALKRGNQGSAIELLKDALEIVRKTGEFETYIDILKRLGDLHFNARRYKDALSVYDRGLRISRKAGYAAGEVSFNVKIGDLFAAAGNAGRALQYYKGSLKYYDSEDMGEQGAEILVQMAENLLRHRQYEEAGKTLNKALQRYTQQGQTIGEANVRLLRARLAEKLKKPEQALEEGNSALQIYVDLGERASEAEALLLVARQYVRTGPQSEAAKFLSRADGIFSDLRAEQGQAKTAYAYGEYYIKNDSIPQAISRFEDALDFARSAEDLMTAGNALVRLAGLHLKARRLDESLAYYNDALSVARSTRRGGMEKQIRARIRFINKQIGVE